jgi:hypothetical protein
MGCLANAQAWWNQRWKKVILIAAMCAAFLGFGLTVYGGVASFRIDPIQAAADNTTAILGQFEHCTDRAELLAQNPLNNVTDTDDLKKLMTEQFCFGEDAPSIYYCVVTAVIAVLVGFNTVWVYVKKKWYSLYLGMILVPLSMAMDCIAIFIYARLTHLPATLLVDCSGYSDPLSVESLGFLCFNGFPGRGTLSTAEDFLFAYRCVFAGLGCLFFSQGGFFAIYIDIFWRSTVITREQRYIKRMEMQETQLDQEMEQEELQYQRSVDFRRRF